MKNNSALFYTCSLIEFIGRQQKLKRSELVQLLGKKLLHAFIIMRMSFIANQLSKQPTILLRNLNLPKDNAISNYNSDFYYQSREGTAFYRRESCRHTERAF